MIQGGLWMSARRALHTLLPTIRYPLATAFSVSSVPQWWKTQVELADPLYGGVLACTVH